MAKYHLIKTLEVAGSGMSNDSDTVVIRSDSECSVCQQSSVQGFFIFTSVSVLVPISCAV